MDISTLPSIVKRSKKRIGRGHGSGKVKTSGRGTKGQKARGTTKPGFEGGQLALIKRLPLLRGKDRNNKRTPQSAIVSLSALNVLPKATIVTLEVLQKYGIVSKHATRAKVLGKAGVTVALTVAVSCSKQAKAAIEKAGGTVRA